MSPTYNYRCQKCGKERDKFTMISKRDDPVFCDCGTRMARHIGKKMSFKIDGAGVYKPGWNN